METDSPKNRGVYCPTCTIIIEIGYKIVAIKEILKKLYKSDFTNQKSKKTPSVLGIIRSSIQDNPRVVNTFPPKITKPNIMLAIVI